MAATACSEFHAVFRSVRSGGHLLTVSMLNSFGCLAVSYAMVYLFHMGVDGLFLGTIGGAVIECIYIAVVFLTGLWVPKDLRAEMELLKANR